MNELLAGLLKELPTTVAMIVIVMVFLKYMAARAKEVEQVMANHDKLMEQLADRYDSTANALLVALRENSSSLSRTATVIERCTRAR